MIRYLIAGLVASALGGAVALAEEQNSPPDPLPTATLVAVAVTTPDGLRQLGPDEPIHTGETLLLAVQWPEDQRPEAPVLIPDTSAPAPGKPLPRRLVPEDPRADGRDTVEVLITALGETEIPAMTLGESDGTATAQTRPLPVTIDGRPGSENEEPSKVRSWVEIPLDWVSLLLIAALLMLLIAGVGWAAVRLRARGVSRPPAEEVVIRPPASVRALDAIEALFAEGLLERNLVKPFSVRLAEIGKGYLGEVAGVPLLESTSQECLRLLRSAGIGPRRVHWLSEWLMRLDMVKFAEARPATAELTTCAEDLKALIVEMTAPAEPEASPEPTSLSREGA